MGDTDAMVAFAYLNTAVPADSEKDRREPSMFLQAFDKLWVDRSVITSVLPKCVSRIDRLKELSGLKLERFANPIVSLRPILLPPFEHLLDGDGRIPDVILAHELVAIWMLP
jgi:hypothetical protein